jgi:hypothetical protein
MSRPYFYRKVVTANGSYVPLTLMSTVWILAAGIAVDAASPPA